MAPPPDKSVRPGSSCRLILVAHGPEVFDRGDMRDLVRVLEPERILVAGVMARTAAEESGIVAEFPGLPPSIVLSAAGPGAVLVNRGKTPDSGRIFGELVASRLPGRGLVHVECSDGTVYVWDGEDQAHAGRIARLLGFRLVAARAREHTAGEIRRIRGCLPGEAVYVNGIVIGTATGGDVLLERRNGGIVPRAGIRTKPHGLEKALRTAPVDLSCAWCKSGPVRMAAPGRIGQVRRRGRVILVDHCAHEVYRQISPEICGMVTVGDDTTAVCAHIGAHLGIPVLGIVDGDADSIVPPAFAPGSVVAHATRERDDDLGREVGGWIDSRDVEWTVFRDDVLTRLEGRVRVIWPGPDSRMTSEKTTR